MSRAGRLAERGERLEEVRRLLPTRDATREVQRSKLALERIPLRSRLALRHELPTVIDDGLELRADRRDLRCGRWAAVLGRELDVRVVDQALEGGREPRGPDPGAGQLLQDGVAVAGQPLQIGLPEPPAQDRALLERDLLEVRIEPDLERTLPQEPRAERVDRPHEGAVDLLQRPAQALGGRGIGSRIGTGRPKVLLEPHLEPLPELTRRLAGEGDRGDLLDAGRARGQKGPHPCHQLGRLSRSRTRLDEQVRLEVAGDALAGGRVGKRNSEDPGLVHGGNLAATCTRGKVRPARARPSRDGAQPRPRS